MQQKRFRIEQMADERRPQPASAQPRLHPHTAGGGDLRAVKHELTHLHDGFAHSARELSALLNEGKDRRMTGELGAVIDAMEKATDKILQSAEQIDDCAKTLGFAQRTTTDAGWRRTSRSTWCVSTRPVISRTSPVSASAR